MFSALQRIQHTTSYFTTVLMVFSAVVSLVSILQLSLSNGFALPSTVANVSPKVTTKMTRRFGSIDNKPKENCRIGFDLEADLSPLFNWNTKQVFAYLTAEYPGKRNDISNRVVFWDKIITSKDKAKLSLKRAKGDYSVYDVQSHFDGRNATLRLEWNIQPHLGLLLYGETVLDGLNWFEFPEVQ